MSAGIGQLDRKVQRYFVYTLSDEAGAPVYVGRSANVAKRIAQHHRSIEHHKPHERPSTWLLDVRSVSMTGPHNWDRACQVEKDTIARLDPRANIALRVQR